MNQPEIRLTDSSTTQPEIRRGRIPFVAIYEVTKSELETLEQGSPSSLFLNLAIFFFSTASSFLASLLTASNQSNQVFTVFVVIVVVGLSLGGVLTLLWWRTHKSTREIVETIRKRIPDENAS